MKGAQPQVLVIGYGNPGRLDDGLGPALVAELASLELAGLSLEATYQLEPEHAELVSRHRLVIFADAAVAGPEPFAVYPVEPTCRVVFSSHGLGPAEVMGLGALLFGASASGYLLALRGRDFDGFGERLSEPARANLLAASDFLRTALRAASLVELERTLRDRAGRDARGPEPAEAVGPGSSPLAVAPPIA